MKNLRLFLSLLFITLIQLTLAQSGTLDNTFSGDGKLTTSFGFEFDLAYSVAIQPDGKIVAVGYTDSDTRNIALARYNTDGTLDNSFSNDGKQITDFSSGSDEAYAVALQTDGKIVVAGRSSGDGTYSDIALARYNTNGTLDNSFSDDGKVLTDFSFGPDDAYAVAIQPDGKIVVAGTTNGDNDLDFVIVQYNTDGTLDLGFGEDGKRTTDFGSTIDVAFALLIQPDGNIVVVGTSWGVNAENPVFALARYLPDGAPDNSFSDDGKQTTDFIDGFEQAYSVALAPDGKIVLAGSISIVGINGDFAIARYNTDGTLDISFSDDGLLTTDFNSNDDLAAGVKIDAEGKIIVAGTSYSSTNSTFAIARYHTDGTLDSGFSGDGVLTTSIGSNNPEAHSVLIQPDGKIVVAGYAYVGNDIDFALARYISGSSTAIFDNMASDNALSISPNPCDNYIFIEGEHTDEVKVINILGQITKIKVENNRIDVDSLSNGTYFLSLETNLHEYVALKFVKINR